MKRTLVVVGVMALLAVAGVAKAAQSDTAADATGKARANAEVAVNVDGVDISSELELPFTVAEAPQHVVFAEDTTLTKALVLRSGDTVELRNGARLSFGPGGYLDSQGTPVDTWSVDDDGVLTKNLARDVRVFGSGDIMFKAGSLPSTIKWTEFDLQPIVAVDHYPLHWHKAGTSPAGTVLDGVVVRNSDNRCIVPHGVDGITIRDTICDTIRNTAIWWNNPTPPAGSTTAEKRAWVEDNSNDIMLDHVLVDNVTVPDGNRGYRIFGFQLQCGRGNEIRNSWANNVAGSSQSGGYYWSSMCNLNAGGAVWTFQNNGTSDSHACSYTWQNATGLHVMDGIECHNTDVLGYGAYNMRTLWRNIESNGTRHDVKAVNTTIEDSELGHVVFHTTPKYGTVTIVNSTIDTIYFNQSKTRAGKGHVVTITNSGVTCDDVTGVHAAASTLTIDGEKCF